MRKIELERAGLKVSNMCLGAMNYGTLVDQETSRAQLDLFLSMGGNFIDTSNNYAWWAGVGDESEKLLGNWLADRGCRDKVILATKVGYDRHGIGQGLKASQIEYWCEESLRNLKTDYIDLYYAHVDDMDTPIEEYMGAFDKLVKSGKVRAIGCSNFYTWRICEAKHAAKDNGWTDFSVNQSCYTYLYTRCGYPIVYPFNLNADEERIKYLHDNQMPLVAYSCLANGAYEDPSKFESKYVVNERFGVLQETAKELGLSTSELVLAWLIGSGRLEGRPAVIPLFSTSRFSRLEQYLKMSEYVLDMEIQEKLTNARF